MLNQNHNNINNDTVSQPEPKKPRVATTGDPENCGGFIARPEPSTSPLAETTKTAVEDSGRERLKRHRMEVAGRVWIPDTWGQESFLKEWVDCSALDSSLVPTGAASARQALVEECRRANSARRLRIENHC